MKKLALSLFLITILFSSVFAQVQEQKNYNLYLANSVISPGSNIEANRTYTGTDQIVFLLQFYQLPTSGIRSEMEAAGFVFRDYLPETAFFVSMNESVKGEQLIDWGARAIIPYAGYEKIHQKLVDRPLPAHTIAQDGKLKILVDLLQGFNTGKVRGSLEANGVEITEEHRYERFFEGVIDEKDLEKVAELPFIALIGPGRSPAIPENYTGRTLHRSNAINTQYTGGRKYNGEGVVVGIGDDGVIGPHIDHQGRIDNSKVFADNGNHGDHIAGTIMGAGNLDPKAEGMANAAHLIVYQVWNAVNSAPSDHITDSVMITSTSYSDGCNDGYTSFARSADAAIHDNPSLLHVFSSGNDGSSNCGYGAGAGWGNVTGGVKIGKNVIAVGNVNSSGFLNGSSSRGPVSDGRIKPEVCAKGTSVYSTLAGNIYDNFTGTSMACPGVSGTCAQLYQAFRIHNGGINPPSALIRGMLMNTANDAGNAGPDFRYGYGIINALKAAEAIETSSWMSDSVGNGDTVLYSLAVPAGMADLRIMLCWNDPEGSVASSKALVNDLNLQVISPTGPIYNPWVLDHYPHADSLSKTAIRGVDNRNNQEQFTIENPPAGNYTIRVTGNSVPQPDQIFYVTWTMSPDEIIVTNPIGGEGKVPFESDLIRWDAIGDTGTFAIEYSIDNGSSWNSIAASVAGEIREYLWVIPDSMTEEALVRVTRGATSGQSDTTFTISRQPKNFTIESACPEYVILSWDSLDGATEYEITMLGEKYMDPVDTVSTNFVQINGLDQTQEYWFGIRAFLPGGGASRRTMALYKEPGIWNCPEPNDAAVTIINAPSTGTFPNCANPESVPVRITLENFSPNDLTNIPVFYQVGSGTVVSETFTDTLPGYGTAEYTFSSATADISGTGTKTVTAWCTFGADVNNLNDTATSTIRVVTSQLKTLPYFQDLESFSSCGTSSNCASGTCALSDGWINSTNNIIDNIDWRVNSAGTPSDDTGPRQDYNPGNVFGQYVYLEASECFGQTGEIISPCIDLTGATAPEAKFWFHMLGGDMGELHTDLFVDGGWINDVAPVKASNWFDKWWEEEIDLTAYVGKVVNLRVRGITGPDYQSDMALDNFSFDEISNIEEDKDPFDLNIYPNPNNGQFEVALRTQGPVDLKVQVVDIQGRIVFQESWNNQMGLTRRSISLENVAKGMYSLIITSQESRTTRKLSVQ